MARRKLLKAGGQPRKIFKTEIQVYEQLLKKIDSGRTLTEIEFSVCNDELKKEYCRKRAASGNVDDWLIDYYDEDTIKSIVKKAINWSKPISQILFNKITDAELIDQYLASRYETGLSEWEKEKFDEEKLKIYYQKSLDHNKFEFYISPKEFNLLDENYKILYIFNQGLVNLEEEIVEWFNIWKKAKGRDIKIDQILAE